MNSFQQIFAILILIALWSCSSQPIVTRQSLTEEKREALEAYWYSGQAEITSYQLNQARYGEMRSGTAVLIFVTEDFSLSNMTKADYSSEDKISVMKLNKTKKFNTGIYPYSIMSSTFLPFPDGTELLKNSFSSQEWCGHVYNEVIKERNSYKLNYNSYFEGESIQNRKLPDALHEDAIWSLIRISPEHLPSGDVKMIPSLEFLRLSHKAIKAYDATLEVIRNLNELATLTIEYPELNRSLSIQFKNSFPYTIEAWKCSYPDGFGKQTKILTTTATKQSRIKTDYWTKNHVADSIRRKKLQLD